MEPAPGVRGCSLPRAIVLSTVAAAGVCSAKLFAELALLIGREGNRSYVWSAFDWNLGQLGLIFALVFVTVLAVCVLVTRNPGRDDQSSIRRWVRDRVRADRPPVLWPVREGQPQRRPDGFRRWPVPAVAALCGGALLHTCLCWLVFPGWDRWHPVREVYFHRDSFVTLPGRDEIFCSTRVLGFAEVAWFGAGPKMPTPPRSGPRPVSTTAELPGWSTILAANLGPHDSVTERMVGFPWNAFYGRVINRQTGVEVSGSLLGRDDAGATGLRLIPCNPLWVGLLADCLFWGAVIWLSWMLVRWVVFVLRQWRWQSRWHQGQCVVCCYDMRFQWGQRCPECGYRLDGLERAAGGGR